MRKTEPLVTYCHYIEAYARLPQTPVMESVTKIVNS